MKKKIRPIILAGGIGKRLLPLSTKSNPKQFIPILIAADQIKHEAYPTVIEQMLDWFFEEGGCEVFSCDKDEEIPF